MLDVELSPNTLLDRQLARLADVALTLIRHRRLTAEHAQSVERSMHLLQGVRSGTAAHNAVGLAGESPVVGIDCLPM